jgi:hypothetical protein
VPGEDGGAGSVALTVVPLGDEPPGPGLDRGFAVNPLPAVRQECRRTHGTAPYKTKNKARSMRRLPNPSARSFRARGRTGAPEIARKDFFRMQNPVGTAHRNLPPAVREAILLSVRLSAEVDGAPKRCRRSACRNSGHCHLNLDSDGAALCPGGISERALDHAAMMLVFLGRLTEKPPS